MKCAAEHWNKNGIEKSPDPGTIKEPGIFRAVRTVCPDRKSCGIPEHMERKDCFMILYFTATGNSAFTAERIGAVTGDEVTDLFPYFRKEKPPVFSSGRPWVIVSPTYAWQLPRMVRDLLLRAELKGNREIYFVLTCGDSIGNAAPYLKEFCRKKQMIYKGCQEIVMPENYLAMFPVPGKEEAEAIIKKAVPGIERTAALIRDGQNLPEKKIRALDHILSGPVNRLFYRFQVSAKKFSAGEDCISCGRCARACPLGNIEMKEGRPVWGRECTHCMACICICPVQTIEYGKKTKGKNRYRCPETGN